MTSFLGVPILIRGQAWGNLYLAEKAGGLEFTSSDEEAVTVLAQVAATAIENARLFEASQTQRHEAETAARGLRAARDISEAIAGVSELEKVLELIVKRGRALVDARSVLIMLREGDELVVAASAGHVKHAVGTRLPISGSTSGWVLERERPERVADVAAQLRIAPDQLGVPGAHTALLVPMVHRGTGVGVLAAFDRGDEGRPFSPEDEELLRSFASSAANAVTIHRSVEADRLRAAVVAADAERARWARELHDQTLQTLGGLRVLLASALRRGGPSDHETAIRQAIEDIELETENLRAIITDLRPSLLDDLGLIPAVQALVERRRADGLDIQCRLDLPDPLPHAGPELETTIYRVLQEALTNVAKHAQATEVRLHMSLDAEGIHLQVIDNGVGFDPDQQTRGFGLAGMRERVYLAGGQLEVSPGPSGTVVRVRVPLAHGDDADRSADQMAS